jgi:hypothetical protein
LCGLLLLSTIVGTRLYALVEKVVAVAVTIAVALVVAVSAGRLAD